MSDNQNEHHQTTERCAHCGLPQSKLPGGMLHKNGVLLCVDDLGCKERVEETSEVHHSQYINTANEFPRVPPTARAAGLLEEKMSTVSKSRIATTETTFLEKLPNRVTDVKKVFTVWVNSDLTEGRGVLQVKHVCFTEETARRLAKGANVQGSDGIVKPFYAFKVDDTYYGPVDMICPTKEDIEVDQRRQAKRRALEKAGQAGLTQDDLAALADHINA